jgi:predicted transcriptional regulator
VNDRVATFLARAAEQPVELTIRELLAIWGAHYRDYDTVGRIERDLAAVALRSLPSFTEGSMSTVVRIGTSEPAPDAAQQIAPPEPEAEEDRDLVLPFASLRVKDIPSAIAGITSVEPNDTLERAQFIMISKGFSQLAVMTGPRALRGTVSWESIAQAYVRSTTVTLDDAIDPLPKIVRADDELFGQIAAIYETGYVLVRDGNECVCGIVTTADLTDQFRLRTEPFFQLGEIERRLRRCIMRAFSVDDVQRVASRRSPLASVDQMTFYQYERLLDDDTRWRRLNWRISRESFVRDLDAVRLIRNPIMHFRTDLLTSEQKDRLASLLRSMRRLDPLP